jgi:transcriptional regulator with XRE-family HTH domain
MSDLGNKKVLSSNLKYYMTINKKTRNDLCHDLNIKYSTVRDWTNGKSYPRIDKIELLSNYFKIQKSDLIENKQENLIDPGIRNELLLQYYIENLATNDEQRDMLINASMLNDKYVNIINEQIEFYLMKQDEENTKDIK